MSQTFCKVAIDGALGSFDKLYTYAVPKELDGAALLGCRVTVPFGKGDAKRQGIIMSIVNEAPPPRVKNILAVTDEQPILNEEFIALCEWMKEHTFCTYFDAIHTMLPAGLKFSLKEFFFANEEFAAQNLLSETERAVFDFLKISGQTRKEKITATFENAEDILSSLEENEAIFKSFAQNIAKFARTNLL